MLKDLGDSWNGERVWTYDVENTGQDWQSETLKCAHPNCFSKFQAVYPDGLSSVNCPICHRQTRIRPIRNRQKERLNYNSESEPTTPISKEDY